MEQDTPQDPVDASDSPFAGVFAMSARSEASAVGAALTTTTSEGRGTVQRRATYEDVSMHDDPPALPTATEGDDSSFSSYRVPPSLAPTSGLTSLSASAPASSSPFDLSQPSAAQPHPVRPTTPPRTSSYSTTALSSSGSSQATLVAGTQGTALSPSQPASQSQSHSQTATQLTATELASSAPLPPHPAGGYAGEESPDPLRIIPAPSSAASHASHASRTAFQRGASRGTSREPSVPLQSSPTSARSVAGGGGRGRSKTPGAAADARGENVDPTAGLASGKAKRRPTGGAGGRAAQPMGVLPEYRSGGGFGVDDDDEEDELNLLPSSSSLASSSFSSSSVPFPTTSTASSAAVAAKGLRRKSTEFYLDVPVTGRVGGRAASGSAGRRSRSSSSQPKPAAASAPAQEERKDEEGAAPMEVDGEASEGSAVAPASTATATTEKRKKVGGEKDKGEKGGKGAAKLVFDGVVVEVKPSSARRGRTSSASAPSSRPSSPAPSLPADPPAPSQPQPQPPASHPLSQSLTATSVPAPSSPLTAIPSSSAPTATADAGRFSSPPPPTPPAHSIPDLDLTSLASSPSTPARRTTRPRRSSTATPAEEDEDEDGEGEGAAHPSPKKKPRTSAREKTPPAPKAKSKAQPKTKGRKPPTVVKAAAPSSRRRSGAAAAAVEQEEDRDGAMSDASSSSSSSGSLPTPQPGARTKKLGGGAKKRRSLFAGSDDSASCSSSGEEEAEARPKKGGKGGAVAGRRKSAASSAAKPVKAKGKRKGRKSLKQPSPALSSEEGDDEDAHMDSLSEPAASETEEQDDLSASDSDSNSDSGDASSDVFEDPAEAKKKGPAKSRGRPPKSAAAGGGSSPTKGGKKAGGAAAKGKGGKKTPAASKGKKGKGKGKQSSPAPSSPPLSQPLSQSQALRPTSSFASSFFGLETASYEPPEKRAEGWSIYALQRGRPVWAHVAAFRGAVQGEEGEGCVEAGRDGEGGEGGGFWWPGEIENQVWDRPVRVKLYLGPDSSVLADSDGVLSFSDPTAADLLTFRNPTKLRFDKHSFRDSPSSSSPLCPSDEAFTRALAHAIEKDQAAEDEEDGGDPSDDGLLPPSSSLARSGPSGSQKSRGGRTVREKSESSEAEVKGESESEDELLKEEDESADMEFPVICLALAQREWWAAQATGYEPPRSSPAKKMGAKANQPKGKFLITWTDSSTAKIARKNLLFPWDKRFLTVNMGKTVADLPEGYFDHLSEFVANVLPSKLQLIISESYPPSQETADDFFAGGGRRNQLAKKAVYGEYGDEVVGVIRDGVQAWIESGGKDGTRPIGSKRYEALGDSERTKFGTDVLLATAVVLNYVDDDALREEAEKVLKKEEAGGATPSEEAVETRAYELGRAALECRSVTKAVIAMRQSKSILEGVEAQRKKEDKDRKKRK